jgi:FkbM family methyltransferase
MNRFVELIKSAHIRPAVIIHVGAGYCGEHDFYTSLDPDKIVYVEPDEYLASVAESAFKNTQRTKVHKLAIASKNGQLKFNITNNRRFSSLLLPHELLNFYPNVELQQSCDVETVTLDQLCVKEGLDSDSDNLLVAELQGMEKQVFTSSAVDTLHFFRWIIIRSSEIDLYTPETKSAYANLTSAMKETSFDVLAFEEDIGPFNNILCVRNDAAIKNSLLKQQLESATDSIRKITGESKRQTRRVEDLSIKFGQKSTELKKADELIQSCGDEINAQQQRITELSKALDEKSRELEKANAQVHTSASELQAQQQRVNELSKALKEKSGELEKANAQVHTSASELQAQQQRVSELSKALEEKSTELETANVQIQSSSDELEAQRQRITELSKALEEKSVDVSRMQQTLRINNKLILKSDSDLRDLQLQYRAAIQQNEHQQSLLSELKDKLRQASLFYQKLNLQNLVIENNDLLELDDSNNEDSAEYAERQDQPE